jgi:hypothetical protein
VSMGIVKPSAVAISTWRILRGHVNFVLAVGRWMGCIQCMKFVRCQCQ